MRVSKQINKRNLSKENKSLSKLKLGKNEGGILKKDSKNLFLTQSIKKIIESIKESEYFQQALTHTSYCHENSRLSSYETLEFLGDSILNFYTSLFIYRSFPDYSEGKMSKLKQLMVQESTLAYLSKEIGLGEYLKLGTGEKKNQGTNKSSILADIFESFAAALYMEKGGTAVYKFFKLTLFAWIKGKENMTWDYKSQLQEYCQANKIKLYYNLKEEKRIGHQQLFIMEVVLENKFVNRLGKLGEACDKKFSKFSSIGSGYSKKEAEQEAAAKVVKELGIGEKIENKI